MATDYWSKEEGAVFDACSYIIPCRASTVILEGSSVTTTTTSTDGYIEVAPSTALGDGIGVACRAAAGDNDMIPVLFYGMYKMIVSWFGANVRVGFGSFVVNSITTMVGCASDNGWNYLATCSAVMGGGSFILGMCMQQTTAIRDEALILIGKTS